VYFFSTKAFLISATVTAKIVCLGFIASRASGVTPIIQTSRVLSLFKSSIISYIGSYSGLGLALGIELVLDLGSGSLSIFFIVGY
jgi:predicted signal transduction protein with EAL and GGDEF domain